MGAVHILLNDIPLPQATTNPFPLPLPKYQGQIRHHLIVLVSFPLWLLA